MSSPARHTLSAAIVVATLSLTGPACAATFDNLHSFCSEAGCADGDYPTDALVADATGDLFGTTALGGEGGWGTIFELVPKKSGYKYRVLHSFCAVANCADGSDPIAGLVIDNAGNLYGTTKFGGAQNGGTVFELVQGRKDKLKILHSFCAQGAACADGSLPMYDGLTYQGAQNGAPYDGQSPLYGTTIYGGENNGGYSGTVYRIVPGKSARKWKESVVWQFCAEANCADGSQPRNGLVMDSTGNLYGVAFAGGNSNNDGVVFELSSADGNWSESVVYDFCSAAECADGANPQSALLPTASGLVGSASGGGINGAGTLFSLAPSGAKSRYSVLYSFCPQAGCSDGYGPAGRLALDASGNLLGTTVTGGDPNYSRGVVFELSAQGTFGVLHTFCVNGNCSDGAWPVGGITRLTSGSLFGTSSEGGAQSDGTLFRLTP
jgi:uncharacterized repeat protein (TIGR03803 family)